MNNEHKTKHEVKPHKYIHKCENPLCGIDYGTNSKASKTCSDRCRQALKRSKNQNRDAKRLYRFNKSPFAHSLARQCIRSGTVQVVPKTIEQLGELHQIFKLASKADGYGATKDYAIAHLCPVRGIDTVGSLHPKNIVVADRTTNAIHRNTAPAAGIGHSIPRCNLESRWSIDEDATPSAVIPMIVQYLGEIFCQQLAVRLKLQPATRAKYLDQLATHMTHEAVMAAGDLADLSTPQLGKLVHVVLEKDSPTFVPDDWGMNAGEVFMAESLRLSKHYPQLIKAHDIYKEVHTELLGLYFDARQEREPEALAQQSRLSEQMFNLTHGMITLEAFKHGLDTTVSHSSNQELNSTDVIACVSFPTESPAFSDTDLEELAALERQFAIATHSECDDIPAFQTHKPKPKPQSAFARFLSG